jgi:DNA (cytosine-5)-methyltransferase 1
MDKQLTMGSLFAGIGGFDLAAHETGIKPVFSCEIEPYPRLVLSARFPDVQQYGDIRKLNGGVVTPVDIITFGSPCQSFSQAGARQGLDGASGLFYEAVRVIKEMREATENRCPRYAIMENVPGIYSSKSNGKSDFREVLNELLKIKDETVDVPEPKDGKFLTAGSIVGDGYSLAWRTVCASKFGVAQRRRRMFLVVDFDGERAGEILSEPEGEGRHFTPSYFSRQGSAGSAEAGFGGVTYIEPGALQRIDKGAWEEKARTIRAHMGDNQAAVAYAYPIDLRNATRISDGGQGVGVGNDGDSAFTVTAEYQHGVAMEQHVIENHANDSRYKECKDVVPTINSRAGCGGGNVDLCVEVKPVVLDERKQAAPVTEDYVGSLTATDYKGAAVYFEPYNICSDASNSMKSGNPDSGIYEAETSRTLDTGGGSPSRNQGGTVIAIQGNAIGRKDGNGPAGIGFREDAA